ALPGSHHPGGTPAGREPGIGGSCPMFQQYPALSVEYLLLVAVVAGAAKQTEKPALPVQRGQPVISCRDDFSAVRRQRPQLAVFLEQDDPVADAGDVLILPGRHRLPLVID